MATTITVRENVTASLTAGSVKAYTLTISSLPTGVASLTVERTSSPLKGASTGTLTNGATIYYGDTLTASATASSNYNSPSLSWTSTTVTGNVTASVTAGSYNPPVTGTPCPDCGEYGYHYCPCNGQYGYPEDFEDSSSGSGSGSGGGSSEEYYTCDCCGYYGPESDFVYIDAWGAICDQCN